LIRLAIRVRREKAELVLAELLELAPSGVEEVAVDDGAIEYAVYGSAGELPALPAVRAAAGDALVDVSSAEIADDWPERWRSYHRPAVVAERLTVRPPWEPAGTTPLEVVIDPGRAFGTGAHATTRLCLELLLEEGRPGSLLEEGRPGSLLEQGRPGSLLEQGRPGSLLDLGCGSGVLAITAARLGFAPVLAVDNDPAAVAATGANAALNGVDIEVRSLDLRSERTPYADTIAANLLAPLLERWARDLTGSLQTPRRVIAGGLLIGEADSVAGAFAAAGLRETRRREQGDWVALALESSLTGRRKRSETGSILG
jgi:ribosomal protein L11 methyltransferase